jgi:hypothetical protein
MTDNSNRIDKLKTFEISLIIIFWVLLFASPLVMGQPDGGMNWKHVYKIWLEHSVLFALFFLKPVCITSFFVLS